MKSTKLLATAAVAAFGALAVGGCAATGSAGNAPAVGAAPAAKTVPVANPVAGTPAAHGHGAVHLTAYTNNDGPTETVIVTGAVGDYGQAVSVYPNGTVDPDHDSQLSLQLSHGTFRLDIAALDKAFVAAVQRDFPGNTTTCSADVQVTGRVPVVAGSGTGAYKGVGGAFTLTITLDEVDKFSATQPCTASSAFLDQAIVITGPGTVAF